MMFKMPVRFDVSLKILYTLTVQSTVDQPVSIRGLLEEYSFSESYLVQVLNDLKRKGLIFSVRGHKGGYYINKAILKKPLCDIVEIILGTLPLSQEHEDSLSLEINDLWSQACQSFKDSLSCWNLESWTQRLQNRPLDFTI